MRSLLLCASLLLLSACNWFDGDDKDTMEPPPPPVEQFTPSLSVSVSLSGSQQVPMNDSMQTTTALIEVDENLMQFRATLDVSGISGVTAAHIHQGRVGQSGDVAYGLEMTDADTYKVAVTDIDQMALDQMLAGQWYINLHTDMYPDGELRGQILTDNYRLITFGLSGKQQVPALETEAQGSGYATYNNDNGELDLRVVTQGADDATMAHIHTGRIGTAGDVLIVLEQDLAAMNTWETPDGTMIDSDTLATLLSGGHYVNVHTPTYPSGELRGQILTDNYVLASFNLGGVQAVPAISTDASGSGYALINMDNYALELKVATQGVEDATMAHIHTGRIGSSGDVLVALEKSTDDANVWMAPEGTMLNADIFAVLASGGHYVNIHTPAYPGGELRGQILTDNYVLATFTLGGDQAVPAIMTDAGGSGYALINMNDYALELKVVTQGVEDATMAHIHTGRIGSSGDVLVALEQSMMDANIWMAPEGTMLNADIFAVLASGGHYVNIHTPAYPSGELRGQILTDNYVFITFPLSGDQAVPAVMTDASGSGYALVNMDNYALELNVVTQGVEDATMAHIHTGNKGASGPVLVALEQSMTDLNQWMTPDGLELNAEIYSVLAGGGHYVNIHTPTYPDGEIRGQIE